MNDKRFVKVNNDIFDRDNSTVAYMDDFQIALHTFDGCVKSCNGCVVNTENRRNQNSSNKLLISIEDAKIIHDNVKEYYEEYILKVLNNKENNGYFGKNSRKVNNFSYTYRFGNHGQVPVAELEQYINVLDSKYNIFSSGAGIRQENIIELSKKYPEKTFLVEFIYDPLKDDIEKVIDAVKHCRENGVIGYLEMILTNALLTVMTPKDFEEKVLIPLDKNIDFGIQLQLGKYVPSANRKFSERMVVPIEKETAWLKEVAKLIVSNNYKVYVLPLGEFAVTLMDDFRQIEYGKEQEKKGSFNYLNYKNNIGKSVIDLMRVSLYIDNNLNVYYWSEDIGQHTLDSTFNYQPLFNLRETRLIDYLSKDIKLESYYLKESNLFLNDMCTKCEYMNFCASHSIDLFRKMIKEPNTKEEAIKNCYGYITVIEEFKNKDYLNSMIENFRSLDF